MTSETIDDELRVLAKKCCRANGASGNEGMEQHYLKIFKTFVYHNAKNVEEREVLLQVLKHTTFLFNKKVHRYADIVMEEVSNTYEDPKFLIRGKDYSNSTNQILSYLFSKGDNLDSVHIQNGKANVSETEKLTLIYTDDFIGSGSQVIEEMKSIDQVFSDCDIFIYCYIWLDKGKESVKDYVLQPKRNRFHLCFKKSREISVKDFTKSDMPDQVVEQIIEICKECASKTYQLGHNDSMTLLAINDQSPNNNLSLTWRSDIKHHTDRTWFPFAPRNMNINSYKREVLQVLRNNKTSINAYIENLKKQNIVISNQQFKLCILAMNMPYLTKNELSSTLGYNHNQDFENDVKYLKDHGIIDLDRSPYRFMKHHTFLIFNKFDKKLHDKIIASVKMKSERFGQLK